MRINLINLIFISQAVEIDHMSCQPHGLVSFHNQKLAKFNQVQAEFMISTYISNDMVKRIICCLQYKTAWPSGWWLGFSSF
jgi:hypothetical protein